MSSPFRNAPPDSMVTEAIEAGRGVRRRSRFIVVGSGKGGTGKTFLAANLAIQWSLWGKRVVLVDADLGLANLHVVLGLDPDAHVMTLLQSRRSRNGQGRELLVPGPAGVQLLPGGSGVEHLASLNRSELRRLVQRLEPCLDDFDVVVVDLSAGISKSTLLFLSAAAEILLVSNPDPSAILDAYAVIKVLSHSSIQERRVHLVMNRVRDVVAANHAGSRILATTEKHLQQQVKMLGLVPEDDAVAISMARRQPFLLDRPNSPAAGAIRSVARRLLSSDGADARASTTAFFARSAELLAPRRRAPSR